MLTRSFILYPVEEAAEFFETSGQEPLAESATAVDDVVRRVEELEQKARQKTRWFKGMSGVRRDDPDNKPERSNKSPRPLCHTTCAELWRAFRDRMREIRSMYVDVSRAFRSGELHVPFPAYTFRPPGHTILVGS